MKKQKYRLAALFLVALMLLGALPMSALAAEVRYATQNAEPEWAALQAMLQRYQPTWNTTPQKSVTNLIPESALMGNGDIGVNSSGTEDEKAFQISKTDFWSCGNLAYNDAVFGADARRVTPLSIGSLTIKEGEENNGTSVSATVTGCGYIYDSDPQWCYDFDGLIDGKWSLDADTWACNGSTSGHSSEPGHHWFQIDLGEEKTIKRYELYNQGAFNSGSANFNTSDFQVSVSTDGEKFTVVDTVTDNTANIYEHTFETAVTARYIKVEITKPATDGNLVARVAEIAFYDEAGTNIITGRGEDAQFLETQSIVDGVLTTEMSVGGNALELSSWVAATENLFVVGVQTKEDHALNLEAVLEARRDVSEYPWGASVGASSIQIEKSSVNLATEDPDSWTSKVAVNTFAIGAEATAELVNDHSAKLSFSVEPGETVYLVTAIGGGGQTYDNTGRLQTTEPAEQAKTLSAAYDQVDAIQQLRQENDQWWKDYWLKSYIDIGDETLHRYYYGSLYYMACASHEDSPVAPGIFGIWTTTDGVSWNGDYHLNYNFIAPFYGLYSSNRLEQAVVAKEPLLDYMEEGEQNALTELDKIYYDYIHGGNQPADNGTAYNGGKFDGRPDLENGIENAVLYPVALGPWGVQTWGYNGTGYLTQVYNAAFSAQAITAYYNYSLDEQYMQEVYPFLLANANFYEAWCEKEALEDGSYRYNVWSGAHEGTFDLNAGTTIGAIKNILECLIRAEENGHIDPPAEKLAVWKDMYEHMAEYPIRTMEFNGQETPYVSLSEVGVDIWPYSAHVALEFIAPSEQLGFDSDPELREASRNAIRIKESMNSDVWNGGNDTPKVYLMAIRCGMEPEYVIQKFKTLLASSMKENFTIQDGAHGIEKAGAIEFINLMLLQSDSDIIKVFPNWTGADARFTRLRERNAFLVSSSLKAGTVEYIEITSEQGKLAEIVNPWGTQQVLLQDSEGNNVPYTTGSTVNTGEQTICFATDKDETYTLLPARKPGEADTDDFSENTIGTNWEKFGSNQSDWIIEDGVCSSVASGAPNGAGQKLIRKNLVATNFALTTKITLNSGGDAGVIFRASDVNNNGDGYNGYYAGISANSLILGKSNQSWDSGFETTTPAAVSQGTTYTLRVSAIESVITVTLWNADGSEKLAELSKEDSQYVTGQVGLRAHNTKAAFDDFSVKELTGSVVTALAVVSQPTKSSYLVNELFDPAGLQVEATYDNGSKRVISNTLLDFAYDFSQETDAAKVIISYQGKQTSVTVRVEPSISFPYADDFSTEKSDWTTYNCTVEIEDGWLTLGEKGRARKAMLQRFTAADLLMQTDITLTTTGDAGFLFRCNDVTEDTDGFRGYYAYINSTGFVAIGRSTGPGQWDEPFAMANSAAAQIAVGETYNVMVAASGSTMKLYLDGVLMVTVEDSMYQNGQVGYRAHNTGAAFDNLYLDGADLELPVVKTGLQRVYNQCVDQKQEDASDEDWAVFCQALEAAAVILQKADATQQDVTEAQTRLANAYAMVRKGVTVSSPGNRNPLMPGYGADPTIHKFGDTYYIYSTTTDRDWVDKPMVWYSKDLVNWEGRRLEMLVDEESYGGEYLHTNQWAASAIEHDGKYYLYYTVYDQVHTPGAQSENNIVAVGDSPMGPFTIKRAITMGTEGSDSPQNSTHDPQVFYDEATDAAYLLYGGFDEVLYIEQLDPDDYTRTLPETKTALLYGFAAEGKDRYAPGEAVNPNNDGNQYFSEGAFLYTRELTGENGETFTRYYLSYSCEGYWTSTYKVRYAYSDNGILGPYMFLEDPSSYYSETPSNIVIRTSETVGEDGYYVANGPGHHSVLQVEVDGEVQDYIVYHKLAAEGSTGAVHRQVCIDRIYYTEDGFIKEVKPTLTAAGVDAIEGVTRRQSLADITTAVIATDTASTGSVYPMNDPKYALDDNYATMWLVDAPISSNPASAQSLTVDLGRVCAIDGFKTDFWLIHRLHQYKIEVSKDGETWETCVDQTGNDVVGTAIDDIDTVEARYVRLTITHMERYEDESASSNLMSGVWEFYIYGEAPAETIPVTGVELDKTNSLLKVGDTLTLTAAVTPANATNKNVTWSSSDETVATVAGGVVTAKKAGTATITVTTEDGKFSDTCTVTVTAAAVDPEEPAATHTVKLFANGGTVTPTELTVNHGETVQLPTPTRSGSYRFEGWYTAYNVEITDETSITEDLTLYAHWRYTGGTHVRPEEPAERPETPAADPDFIDVRPSDWYAEAVAYVAENGIMTGVDEGVFNPDGSVTRAMVWTVLARMDGVSTEGGSTWYAKAQAWAMETGVSDGTDPNGAITREQLAAMLYRFEGSPAVTGNLSAYPDANQVSDWAVDALLWATQEGIIEGMNGRLSPKTGATRAQLATMLMRMPER